MFQTFETEVIR